VGAPHSSGPESATFRVFLAGQATSNLGTSLTLVALPLVVLQLTGSASDLGAAAAAEYLPYLLFGLPLGAYVDRWPRAATMLTVDALQAVVVASVPLLAAFGQLRVGWIFLIAFLSSTLAIAHSAAQFALVPSLVQAEDLVRANGRLSAGYSAATVGGPLVGAALFAVVAPVQVLWIDAATYVLAALSLGYVYRHVAEPPRGGSPTSIRTDVLTGLRFVFANPVLRTISLVMLATNLLVGSVVEKQIVTLAEQRFAAGNDRVALLFAVAGLGAVTFSLAAARVGRVLGVGRTILVALFGGSACIAAAGVLPWYAAVVLVWGIGAGLAALFSVNVNSLRQRLAPPDMLGRVMALAAVLAWSARPLGSLAGGYAIEASGDIGAVFLVLGGLQLLVTLMATASPLRDADRLLATAQAPATAPPDNSKR
jgi:MFS family permease